MGPALGWRTIPAMQASTARPSCPSCGIAVTPGYQRCPRCHHELPTSVRFSRIADGGGATSTAALDESQRRWPWYLAGLVILAGAVAVVVIGSSGGRHPAPLPDDPVVEDQPDEPQAGSADDDQVQAPPPSRPDPGPIGDRLARNLARVRLYATVEVIADTVEIWSSFCADPGIPGLVAEVAPDLRDAGVITVRCRALHGAEQWSRPLP